VQTVEPARISHKAIPEFADFAHTGPGTLAGEYMRRFWQPVMRSEDLLPARALPITIMSENYTLFRGEGGEPHVVAQRCPHRSTVLSVGTVEGDSIRCHYHGWRFDGGGQCVEQPAEDDGFAAKVRIAGYPTREHVGLIFAYFGPGEPPSFPNVPAFPDGITEARCEVVPINYFQSWENTWDEVHVAWTHRAGGMHAIPDLSQETFEETDYGVLKRSQKSDGLRRVAVYLMPNIIRVLVPPPNALDKKHSGPRLRESYLFLVPIDDENHMLFNTQEARVPENEREAYAKVYAEYLRKRAEARPRTEVAADILAGKLRIADVLDHPNLVTIEDIVAQAGQGRIVDRSQEWLGRSDAGIIFLRKLWMREMRALAEGCPLKQWAPMKEMPRVDNSAGSTAML
jgi:5,5'-dehydrodivanillate O-demethylase